MVGTSTTARGIHMTPNEYTRYKARCAGRSDRLKGLDPDPGRYDALPDSAWADWYWDGYDSITPDEGDAS